jgi:hypothetical protein
MKYLIIFVLIGIMLFTACATYNSKTYITKYDKNIAFVAGVVAGSVFAYIISNYYISKLNLKLEP